MRVVIIGCGRSGSLLAARLASEGVEVTVVDRDGRARDRLPKDFAGGFLVGDAMHRPVLEAAGVARSDGLVAISPDDSFNIVVARIAREVFHVPHVVCRLYDVERAPICTELGLPMVTSVHMTVDRVHRMLRHPHLEPERTFGNGETQLVRSPVPAYLASRPVREFNVPGEIQVVELSRGGHSRIPDSGTTLQAGDRVSFVVASRSLGRLRAFLGGRWH